MKRISILSLFAALCLAMSTAFADSGPDGGGRWHGWHRERGIEKHLEQLGLDAAQKTKVQAILDASKKEREARHEKLRAAFGDLKKLLDQDSPDVAAVDQQIDKLGALKTEARKSMMHTLLAIRKELTPEQRAKMKELHQKAWKRHGGRHGHERGEHGEHGDGGEAPSGSEG